MLRILQWPASASCYTRPPYIELIPCVDMVVLQKKKGHHPLIAELFELRDVRKPRFDCTCYFLAQMSLKTRFEVRLFRLTNVISSLLLMAIS